MSKCMGGCEIIMLVEILFIQLCIMGIDAGERTFDCPTDCPLNLYEPICSRGISYTSLCALQQEVCNGKLDDDVLKDIEQCSKFTIDKDQEDAVAIDKNGVILRSFFPDKSNGTNIFAASKENRINSN